MKKIYTLAILSAFVAGNAVAGTGMHHNNMHNNHDMNTVKITTVVEPVMDAIVTVNQIPTMMDNQNVVMTGYLVESLGDEMYVFQDSTGSISVEIEPVILGDMVVMPDMKMKLKGEIDKGDNGEPDVIEVDYITTM
ncbi:MAG: NirD/YgiW/YdeI family stress tolerance protein [Proteobacteria bacterium]|nr:NirD/YgiW/YdeI family stress tolerance protein [Candidatus Enterousia onthequi]